MRFGWRELFRNCWVILSVVKIGSLTAVLYLWDWMNFRPCLQHCSIRVRFCGRLYIRLWTYIKWNVHVYQATARLFECLSNACALRHSTLLVRAITPRSLSLRHFEVVRMQSVYMCALTLLFETSNYWSYFKAGVCVVAVFYRFFLHNIRVISLR